MCRNLTLLAKNDRRQMIFTCEHGSIHITHQFTTILMSRHVFIQIAALFGQDEMDTPYARMLGFRMEEAVKGQVDLWIGSGGFRLDEGDFRSLAALIQQSVCRLREAPHARLEQEPPSLFSPN